MVIEGEPRLCFAGDACYSEELLQRGEVDGIATDAAQARTTLARMRTLAAERETIVLPTHDPDAPARLTRHRDQHRRFAPRVAQDAQRDALEPDQISRAERIATRLRRRSSSIEPDRTSTSASRHSASS